jgi:hypothetical protein
LSPEETPKTSSIFSPLGLKETILLFAVSAIKIVFDPKAIPEG